jgi:hypothetical protein
MKKTITKIILAGAGSLLFVVPALAATVVSLSPTTLNVAPGQTFNVAISVNPQGSTNYAEKVELTYPADLLEVRSFTQGNSWMGLTQSGYDSIDNTNGTMLKSAGYAGGITTLTPFGNVTFYAKKAGKGEIKIGGNSVAFEASTQNALSGDGTIVTVAAATQTTTTATPTKTTGDSSARTSVSAVAKTPSEVAQPAGIVAVQTEDISNQVAAAATASSFNLNWLWIPVIIIIVGAAYYFIRKGKKV